MISRGGASAKRQRLPASCADWAGHSNSRKSAGLRTRARQRKSGFAAGDLAGEWPSAKALRRTGRANPHADGCNGISAWRILAAQLLAVQAVAVASNGDDMPRVGGIRLHVAAQAHDEAVDDPGLRIGA